MPEKFASIDAYIASFPPETGSILRRLRETIRAAAPEATEAISYNIPTFRQAGTYLVYFAGWKKHVSIYPIPKGDPSFEAAIAPYREEKGTLRFPLSAPIPYDLVTRIVEASLAGLPYRSKPN